MSDWVIHSLLKKNPTGWRGQALMLKQASENDGVYMAAVPNVSAAIKNMGDTGLLDVFRDSLFELERRSHSREDFSELLSYWIYKAGNPEPLISQIKKEASDTYSEKQQRRLWPR
jgi:hypothetical protein